MSESTISEKERPGWKITLLACLAVFLVGAGVTVVVFSTEPTATRSGATKETAMLVEVIEVRRGTYRPTIVAMGTVQASQDITLRPRVGGEILERSSSFTPGGFVEAGEVLLQIDPADYENTLQERRSELSQINADLMMEMGQQDVARRDFQFLDGTLSAENEALVLRQPQLKAIQARVEAARAAVAQAELHLERTQVRAPFDARVLARNANVGSLVAAGADLGRLVGLEDYWVVTSVPLSKLAWLSFADGANGSGSDVRVRNRTAWARGEYRAGYLDRLVGALDDATRMAEVLVTVPDPLGRESGPDALPPLIIGAYLEAQIEGREIADVIRMPRDFVRQGDRVWIMEEGELQIREVEVVFSDAEYAYVSSGLEDGDQVVTTSLSTVVAGARLRLEPEGGPIVGGEESAESEAGNEGGPARADPAEGAQ